MKGYSLRIHYVPKTEHPFNEFNEEVVSESPDVLRELCSSCVYGLFDFILPRECRTCAVQQTIVRTRKEKGGEA